MLSKIKLFTGSLLIASSLSYAQTGPGGVGSSADNSLWLQADDISQADGTSVSTWADRSGNGNDATQGAGANQPTYETSEVGGRSVVRLDGVDDYFDDARTYNARTFFSVYNILSANQATSDLGQIWGEYSVGWHVALDARSPGTYSFDGRPAAASGNQGRHALNGAAYGGFSGTSATPSWSYDQPDLLAVEFNANRTINRQVIGSLLPTFGVGVHQYGGDIAEIIVYNTTLNTAQRIIVENYLAARYGLTIANDYYAYQGIHPNEVAGIGREDASNTHTAAMSADILQVQNPSGLDANNEYLLFGHDNADITSAWTTTEAPNGGVTVQRLAREWRFSETGDVGTVDFLVDVAALPALPAGFTKYALMVDADGDFSTGADVYEIGLVAGTTYDVLGIDIADGDYVAIGVIDPEIEFTSDKSNGFEPFNASINIVLNYIPRLDVTVDYTTTDGTALVGQPDYTGASPLTATILAGSSTGSFTIPINDDAIVEPDENFIITLSNPGSGVALGVQSNHTYTINDDDDARKIYFDLASASGDESISPVSVNVSMNTTSATDVTVDYTVTGGTATSGAGNDFVLAAGTITIVGGSGLTTGSFTFTVNDDLIFETNETIIISLSSPTGCNLDNPGPVPASVGTGFTTHTYTIIDNDTPPEIQFTTANGSGVESVSPVSINVSLNTSSQAAASATYTVADATAVSPGDYTMASGTVSIAAGLTSANLLAAITNDGTEELPETFTITLSAPVNATLGGNTVFTYTIIDDDNIGYVGPGGVGEASNLQLWLRSEDIPGANGANVFTWSDFSGNNHDATAPVGFEPQKTDPVVNLNNRPAVTFDGTGEHFSTAHAYSGRTVFSAYQMLNGVQNTGDLAQLWGDYSEGVHVGIDARGARSWSFDGSGGGAGRFGLNGAAYTGFANNPTTPKWTYSAGEILAVEFQTTRSILSQDIGSLVSLAGHFLGADVGELAVFDITVNDAQRIIIENYLAAKYGVGIANDLFAHETFFGNEVAGIGRIDINNFHIDAQGSSMVRINNPSDLEDGEYLIWGHNNVDPRTGPYGVGNTLWAGELPVGVNNSLHRVWQADETGGDGVGTIDLKFDITGLIIGDAADLVLLIDTDGDFVDATVIPISSSNATYANFDGISLPDDHFFTLGSTTTFNSLPIELISFNAEINKGKVDLTWQTASEINNDFFTIQRSIDGLEWETIAVMNGAGNSSSILNYSTVDSKPIEGLSFYRLKQTDFDGQFTYSKVESVLFEDGLNNEVLVYPNPTNGKITVVCDRYELGQVIVLNSLGQDVTKYTSIQNQNEMTSIVDLSSLSNGIYFIKTKTSFTKVSKK